MKFIAKSRMIWAAVVTGAIGVLTVIQGENLVSVEAMGYIVVVIGVLNGVLRMMTTKELYVR